VSQLVGTLKKCYDAWEIVDTAEKAAVGEESTRIVWVAISLVGAATPEAFFAAIAPRDIESGFVNRMLILPFESFQRSREQAVPHGTDVPPAALIAGLKRLPRQRLHAEDLLNQIVKDGKAVGGKLPNRAPPMCWGPGAAEVYYAFSARMDGYEETDPNATS
jgi:hypothetical protein